MEIFQAQPNDSENIAIIHYNNFKNAFLCDLGINFLILLYNWILSSNSGFGFIVKNDNKIIGFVSGVYNSSGIISSFIKKNFLKAAPLLVLNCFKKPKNLKRIFETIFYPKKSDIDIKAELLSIAVDDNYRGKGYSQELFRYFKEYLEKQDITVFKITVDKDNVAANKFYINRGCKLVNTYQIYCKYSNIYKCGTI